MLNKIKKSNKKILISIICFLSVTLLMFILYNVFKNLNNQLYNELSTINLEEIMLLPKESETWAKFNKSQLYYNLGIASKYIGCCTLVIAVVLSFVAVYKHFKN